MKVYVLIFDEVIDYDDFSDVKVFANRKDALAELAEWAKEKETYATENGWEIEEICEDYFSDYEEGYYAHNHAVGRIEEREVL